MARLVRKLGTFDAALIVMGGIIGSGIFMNPSVVARYVHTGPLIMLAWIAGGLVALLGAGLFAELAERRPSDGGLYAYMSDAFHPVVAFCYGWTLLLVSQSGGSGHRRCRVSRRTSLARRRMPCRSPVASPW